MKELKLEINPYTITDPSKDKMIMITPPIDQNYWTLRVHLYENQYIVAFPKFGTIAIGFAIEDDWNTNLPYLQSPETILKHIWHNRRYVAIKKNRTLRAIKLIQDHLNK